MSQRSAPTSRSIPWSSCGSFPGLGTHLPAVLLHDGLVVGPTEGKTHIGPDIDREEADRILRDAMASLGTPVVRRWLMWTAVASPPRPRRSGRAGDGRPWSSAPFSSSPGSARWRRSTCSTWRTCSRGWATVRGWPRCCWAASFAVVVPLVVSVLWGRAGRAGAIAGVALALLLHVTVVVAAVYGIYWVLEKLASAPQGDSPSAKANLEEADTSEGMYLPAG